jgi:hypothetical protein
MKIKTILGSAVALMVSIGMAKAAHIWENPGEWGSSLFVYDATAPKFTAQELSLDLFGSYNNPEHEFTDIFHTNIRHGTWGGGVGVNYFLFNYLGFGSDVNLSDHPGRIVDQVLGDLTLRAPIGNSGIAPYIIGSVGRGIYPAWEWIYGFGPGLDLRLNPTLGIFADARYFWAEAGNDRLLIRTGLRIVF